MAKIDFLTKIRLLIFGKLSIWMKYFVIILIVIISLFLSTHIADALYKRSVKSATPDQFSVILYAPPNNIFLQRWSVLKNNLVLKGSYILLPNELDTIITLNKQLTQQYAAQGFRSP